MEGLIHVVNGSALVTACTAATGLSLSANNVGFGAQVTLSWSGAAGGAGNPIRGYEVYRDGALLTTCLLYTSGRCLRSREGEFGFRAGRSPIGPVGRKDGAEIRADEGGRAPTI